MRKFYIEKDSLDYYPFFTIRDEGDPKEAIELTDDDIRAMNAADEAWKAINAWQDVLEGKYQDMIERFKS